MEETEDNPKTREKETSKHLKKFALKPDTYWLTRIVILRSIACVYFVAFLVALQQNKALIGKNGILPADQYMKRIRRYVGDYMLNLQLASPSLLWFMNYETNIDFGLDMMATAGLVISLLVIMTGKANMIIMFLLWILYHSIINLGQRWYSFGWESQLLETGFLAIFLCRAFKLNYLKAADEGPSRIYIGCYRWLIFRIMIGAGLIKIRGDQCWRDLTCMNYHYLTQPVPNPIAPFLHITPVWFHKFEVLSNHIVELFLPLLLVPIFPRWCRNLCGVFQVLFQVILIISGNLSFLNWLTIIPSLACFDDLTLSRFFPMETSRNIFKLQNSRRSSVQKPKEFDLTFRRCFDIAVGLLLCYLSLPVALNLVSSRQVMNTSFEPFRIVNTYGAFGSVTKTRNELIVQGTNSTDQWASDRYWLTYEFKCKPGNPFRRPCFISPYHYRLDWLMWFAAFQQPFQNEWLLKFGIKLLQNDPIVSSLLSRNPFLVREDEPNAKGPNFIRILFYEYKYCTVFGKQWMNGQWWCRKNTNKFYWPPMDLHDLQNRLS